MTHPAPSARFLIVGPQGSGKGTQGVLVAEAAQRAAKEEGAGNR